MVIVLGLGFTGQRLARRLLREGVPVCAAVRGVERFRELADAGLTLSELKQRRRTPEGRNPRPFDTSRCVAPALHHGAEADANRLCFFDRGLWRPGRRQRNNAGRAQRRAGRLRLEEEHWIAAGPWTSLILRAAAIYGPGRGVHAALGKAKCHAAQDPAS